MKYFKISFKILIILMLLILTVGAISAADNADSTVSDNQDYNFDLDEDLDDDSDYEFEDDSDYEFEDDFEDNSEDDWDYELDDDDDWDDEDWDDDLDDNDSTDYFTSFNYLELKILFYLDRYGNCSEFNWTESEDFYNEYQIYLSDPSNYKLNQSAEGYETYLKIFDSITSTFGDYNLTENQTDYLKFMIIYYLNHFGNVSANYTWNESDDFANFTPPIMYLDAARATGFASSPVTGHAGSYLNHQFNPILGNIADRNSTAIGNVTNVNADYNNGGLESILTLILLIILVVLVII